MDIFGIYILMFFILFLVMPIVYFILRVILWFILDYCGFGSSAHRRNRQNIRQRRHYNTDRQGNNFATAEEAARDNRFNDIFFIEPNSPEAARIRAQLEKDDKDLPSYDEVMRMTNLSTPTAAPAAGAVNFVPAMPSALSMGASSSSVNTTDTTLTVPPYTSADPNVSSSSRPLTPPPYTPEPIGASVVLPITTPLHSQQPAQSS
ncbi:uncharacterized protein LOC119608731 isoform X3 [Lucilia sericata]|uniref:uncharacterized protein LOC119608731 isoform X3 n=1 Tax=Lucilia sericata TaxID=13632 RepID=UPI0018A845F8|nr:uncharacterized protein LOC119608731 isoform X3 [Lucilia sericata]